MRFSLLVLFLFASFRMNAQQGQWIWMKGTSQPYGPPVWGTKGVPAAANTPPGLTMSISWTDTSGRLWLFGGYDPTGTYPSIGYRDALWMYDPAINMWTWVKGTNLRDQHAVYGTMGVPDTANRPSARRLSAHWVDQNGDLWLFGGEGVDGTNNPLPTCQGALNDLWRYNIATNTWTWMGGTSQPNAPSTYGTLGVPTPNNIPSGRSYTNSWVDLQGNFWLFGGHTNVVNVRTNEMWMYNPTTNMWTWVMGGPGFPLLGVAGTQNVPSPNNIPPARFSSAGWSDASGNLWLFGGEIDTLTFNNAHLEDVWKFNVPTQQWTWVSGSVLIEDTSVFTPPCVAPAAALPGGLGLIWESGCVDACGYFWLYGGSAERVEGTVNNLWCYNPALDHWYFASGSQYMNQAYYGIQGVANPLNCPSAHSDVMTWWDNNGNFWMMGGSGNAVYNDLWKFTPNYCCNPEMSSCCEMISVHEQQTEQISVNIFPNPAAEQLTITSNAPLSSLELFDAAGQLVLSNNSPIATNGTYTISLAGLCPGSYILRFSGPAYSGSHPIILAD